jgi:hypothetical protein
MTNPCPHPDPLTPYPSLEQLKEFDSRQEKENAKAFLFSLFWSIFLTACLVWYNETLAPKPETQLVSVPVPVANVQLDVYYDKYSFDTPVYPCYSKKDRAWLFSTTDDGEYSRFDRSRITPVRVWTLPRVPQGPYCKK